MISQEDVIKIHELLIDQFGGSHGVRDKNSLNSAVNRPFATFDQQELYPEPIEKATAILESIVTNHPLDFSHYPRPRMFTLRVRMGL